MRQDNLEFLNNLAVLVAAIEKKGLIGPCWVETAEEARKLGWIEIEEGSGNPEPDTGSVAYNDKTDGFWAIRPTPQALAIYEQYKHILKNLKDAIGV